MSDHNPQDFRIQDVTQESNGQKDCEIHHVQDENDDGEIVKPLPIVREGVEENGHDSSSHIHREPAGDAVSI